MVTDPLFYKLFETSPETLFLLLGLPADEARDMAARHQFQAIEFKETAHRCDGVFIPKDPAGTVYFVEFQFYRKPSVFADLLAKVFTYLKNHDPRQEVLGVVLFASQSLEPKEIGACEPMLERHIRRFYLDEMKELADAPLSLSILHLIGESESEAPAKARELIRRSKAEIADEPLQKDLIELIERVMIYKFKTLTRQEIEIMLQIHDIRESRLWQEAKGEGIDEGIQRGIAIAKLAGQNKTAEEIAAILKLDVEQVRKAMADADRK